MPWPKGKPSWNAGLTKTNDTRIKRYAETLSKNLKGRATTLSEEGRKSLVEKARKNILDRYASGWECRAGRCKRIQYESPVAGIIWVHGTWELKVAQWLDEQKFNWRRNKDRFPYKNLNGTISHYTPDFFVDEFEGYLEIKGYETKLDRCKWEQFEKKLIVWKRQDLEERGILT